MHQAFLNCRSSATISHDINAMRVETYLAHLLALQAAIPPGFEKRNNKKIGSRAKNSSRPKVLENQSEGQAEDSGDLVGARS